MYCPNVTCFALQPCPLHITSAEYDQSAREKALDADKHRSPLRLFLIRHAESEGNVPELAHLIHGRQSGLKLTPKGEDQARCLKISLANEKFDAVYCSTALRTQMTASLAGLKAEITPDVAETCHGSFEQRPRNECWTESVKSQMEANPWLFRSPGFSDEGYAGESVFDVELRMTRSCSMDVGVTNWLGLWSRCWSPKIRPP